MFTFKKGLKDPNKVRKINLLNPFLIIIGLMVLFVIISWIANAARVSFFVNGGTKSIKGLGILDIFPAIINGFIQKAPIILFILILGGILEVMSHSKILDEGLETLITKMKGKELWLINILIFAFALGGTTFGMWEETLPFLIVLIPVFVKLGYDAMTAILIVLLGAGTGCLASTINPFSIGIAFTAMGSLPSGITNGGFMGTRWIIFLIFTAAAVGYINYYAIKVKKTNLASSVLSLKTRDAITKKFHVKHADSHEHRLPKLTRNKKWSLFIFFLLFFIMVLSLLPWDSVLSTNAWNSFNEWMHKWFFWLGTGISSPATANSPKTDFTWSLWGNWSFMTLTAMFLTGTIMIAILNRRDYSKNLKETKTTIDQNFMYVWFKGVSGMLIVSFLIATAAGLSNILMASNIGDWIASSGEHFKTIGLVGFAIVMFILCLFLSILIPSTSGFATAFIPILGGVALQAFPTHAALAFNIVVLAFIFGNGIANLFTPTSAALMAYTHYALIDYKTWLKTVWKIILVFIVISVAVLVFVALQG